MDTVTGIFSAVCGQNHCLPAGGALLPVCQRCLGLYVGALLTAAWLAATGLWRRGLPSWSVFVVHVAVLLAAMFGGLHAWGDSPAMKVACGLWTGHVAMLWLVGGAVHLRLGSRRAGGPQLPWRTRDKLQALAAPLLLAGLAAAAPRAMALGWWPWTAAALLGAAALLLAGALALVATAASLLTPSAGARGTAG